MIFKDEVYQIVGAALEVSNHLGCGFLEAVYQEALSLEFAERHIPYVQQKRIQIKYKNTILQKHYMADFLCYEKIIVEIKAIKQLTSIEAAQILNYLKATGHPVGVLLNFGSPRFEWKRYINTRNLSDHARPFAVNLLVGQK